MLLDNPFVCGYTTTRLGSSRLFPRRAIVVIHWRVRRAIGSLCVWRRWRDHHGGCGGLVL